MRRVALFVDGASKVICYTNNLWDKFCIHVIRVVRLVGETF